MTIMKQSKALRLADELETNLLAIANRKMKSANLPLDVIAKSYTELRRLHEANRAMIEALEDAASALEDSGKWNTAQAIRSTITKGEQQ